MDACGRVLVRYWHLSLSLSLQQTEKKIANQLKWDLNAVTAAEFIEELSPRLADLVPPEDLDRLIDHAHTIANVCLLCKFVGGSVELINVHLF